MSNKPVCPRCLSDNQVDPCLEAECPGFGAFVPARTKLTEGIAGLLKRPEMTPECRVLIEKALQTQNGEITLSQAIQALADVPGVPAAAGDTESTNKPSPPIGTND